MPSNVMNEVTCPECQLSFDADAHRKYQGIAGILRQLFVGPTNLTAVGHADESILVVCPGCGHSFPNREYRFFGFLSYKCFILLLITFIVVILALDLIVGW
jgi:endogenous inhibitor of DNA gyrase (YacG/DUF329 family)